MILGATISSVAFADQSYLGLTATVHPAPSPYGHGNGSFTAKNNWSYVQADNKPAKGVTVGSVNAYEIAGSTAAMDYVLLGAANTATELWLRIGGLGGSTAPKADTDIAIAHRVMAIYSSTTKLVASLDCSLPSSDQLTYTWKVYDPTTQAVVNSKDVCTITPLGYGCDAYGNNAIDFRIYLDNVAGYVQAYNTASTLIGEFLGQTCTSAGRECVGLGLPRLFQRSANFSCAYALLSTTCTFGMYVLPLLAKSAGTVNNALAGDYTNFTTLRTTSTIPTPLKLEAAAGETKQFDAKYTSMADIGLPANFKLDALAVKLLTIAESPAGGTVTPKIVVSLNGTQFHTVDAPVVANVDLTLGKYQTKSALFNLNPATSAAWQVTDLANLYVGFKLEL